MPTEPQSVSCNSPTPFPFHPITICHFPPLHPITAGRRNVKLSLSLPLLSAAHLNQDAGHPQQSTHPHVSSPTSRLNTQHHSPEPPSASGSGGKSPHGKHLIHQAAVLIDVFPPGSKRQTFSLHNKFDLISNIYHSLSFYYVS